ncbi:probable ubiquitin-conjugating enzyme E2 24 [Cynara cardunculus var. scolymus]|uniref:probable ubiquitin-conjugating enzyme E2 24 n=1 Tax=Cynara cardunculus var. scolymus TaxID=59895 RepID=UPI000D62A1EC|nr:probable ubiquitin-conjugating enzyme E2 24 [Cynara cardunculus var. scolymus]
MDVFVSDFDSYSESSSSDDQEDDEFMYGGQASCILLNLQETIGKIDDFLLFERKYVHGDIVCLLKDPYSQMGRVTNVEMVVDLENLNEKKLNDIDSKELQRIRSISTGDYVVSGPWVGKADQITDFVTVLFDDGTRCEFTITGMEKLVPVSPDMVDDYPYYPGQRVKLANSTISKSTQWFCGSREVKHDEGTVCTIDAGLVYVTWLGCALFGSESQPVPPSLQSSKDLTPISCFTHSHWQIGDWCTLPKIRHSGVHNQSSKSPEFQEIFVIAKIRSKIDVLWQDGSESYGLDSSSLGPINTLDAHDFWPHQLVLEKGTCDDQNDRKWGVVKVVESKEKTVKVKWESETEGEDMEETVSAYELIEHPDYTYSHGDLVFRLHKGQNFEDTEQFYSNCHLARIGTVIGFKNGVVEVKWAAGFTSKVAPHEIFRVEKSEGISATPLLNNDNIEPKLEKSEHDNHTPDSREKNLSDSDDDEKDCLKTIYDSTTFNVSRAAIGFLSNVATRLFGSPLYTSLPVASDHVPGNGPVSGFDSEEDDQMFVETSTEAEFKETEESKGVSVSSATKTMKEIRQFDMVNDCSNHHFIDSPGKGSISSQVKKCWLKKVQQEWNILANDLPETIYVRVFEERMDLIQAAVVGAPGTPYHDAIFFFDIFLPSEYPHEPPMVHYNSGGLRVNPNLYESGRVCLSLLNTWTGTGSETWNPNGSTILQVLLSLQALVLNKKPYFNEAGYDQQVGSIEGEKNSCSYNENAFLMSCKSMLYILRKPPKHFEALVEEHFRERCMHILRACKAYLEGVPIGCAFGSQPVELEAQKGNSTGFKIMLAKLVPKLVEAFTSKGFDCANLVTWHGK